MVSCFSILLNLFSILYLTYTFALINVLLSIVIGRTSKNITIDGSLPDETVPDSNSNIFVSVEGKCAVRQISTSQISTSQTFVCLTISMFSPYRGWIWQFICKKPSFAREGCQTDCIAYRMFGTNNDETGPYSFSHPLS